MTLILFIFSFLNSQDIIKYPEKLPINNQKVIEHLKKKEQPQLLGDEYWDDERILFSTYFGGSGYDCINDGAFDSKGNFIQVGYTGSPDLPIVGDAFQKDKNLNHDMFIVKWNPEGDVIWSTFLGGSSVDVLYSVAIDKNDDIIVAGRTESTDIIVSENAPQLENNGGSDFYIAKFNTNGEYIWSTYWGGIDEELQCRMVIDEVGNIYLAGTTTSSSITTKEDAFQRNLDKEWSLNGEWRIKTGVYLAKFTSEGKYNWGTYFATGSERITEHKLFRSLSFSEVLTSIDVYKDEIAFSWDAETYYERDGEPLEIFHIVTDDAEQKKGVQNAGWQAQIFKIDTSGKQLKYGTYYSADYSSSKKIKYDKEGNLYCLIGANRLKPRKDSLFSFKEKNGVISFVKYNRNNELEWDFSYGCENESGSIYDFDIDEYNVLLTSGKTSCKNIEKGANPFPTKYDVNEGATNFIFILNLNDNKHWFSYYDIGIQSTYNISSYNNNLLVSGSTDVMHTKNGIARNGASIAPFVAFDMNNVFNYEVPKDTLDTLDPADSLDIIDTLDPKQEIIFYPNPINDFIYLGNIDSVESIRVVDMLGKEFINIKEIKSNQINLSNLSIGVYFIIINEEKVYKILKE